MGLPNSVRETICGSSTYRSRCVVYLQVKEHFEIRKKSEFSVSNGYKKPHNSNADTKVFKMQHQRILKYFFTLVHFDSHIFALSLLIQY